MNIFQLKKILFLLVIITIFFAGCKKGDSHGNVLNAPLNGVVEKGPFIRGSRVSVAELDNNLNPTGKIFETDIQNDEGFFELKGVELKSRYVQLTVNGFYFDEITGRLSNSQITIGALADVQSQHTVNVNVITHLEQKRVRHLISREGKSFLAAKKQAQKEILAAFYIKDNINTISENISITNNNESGDILLSISSAILNGISSDADLTEKLSSLSQDIEANGKLSNNNDAFIALAIRNLNIEQIKENVISRYKKLGKEIEIGNFASYFSIGIIPPTGYYETMEQFSLGFKAAQDAFINSLEEFYVIEGLYSNSVDSKKLTQYSSFYEIYNHNIIVSNSYILSLWRQSYYAISRLDQLALYASKKNEAQFKPFEYYAYPYLGMVYWSLMEMWGEVPYPILQERGNPIPFPFADLKRSPISTISNNLIDKIEQSALNIDYGKNEFGFDKAFPLAVLVRLALQAKDYAKVKQYAEQIINSNKYQLADLNQLHSTANETIIGYPSNRAFNYEHTPKYRL